jgi:hypothetical protein
MGRNGASNQAQVIGCFIGAIVARGNGATYGRSCYRVFMEAWYRLPGASCRGRRVLRMGVRAIGCLWKLGTAVTSYQLPVARANGTSYGRSCYRC